MTTGHIAAFSSRCCKISIHLNFDPSEVRISMFMGLGVYSGTIAVLTHPRGAKQCPQKGALQTDIVTARTPTLQEAAAASVD